MQKEVMGLRKTKGEAIWKEKEMGKWYNNIKISRVKRIIKINDMDESMRKRKKKESGWYSVMEWSSY